MSKLKARVRYVEDFMDKEAYLVEIFDPEDKDWGLDTAYYLEDDRVSWKILGKLRDMQNWGYSIKFV